MSHDPRHAGLPGRAAWRGRDVLLWDISNLKYFEVFRRESEKQGEQ